MSERPPLVVIDADVLGRHRTGDETYVEQLLRNLPALGPDLRYAAVTRHPELVPPGIEPIRLGTKSQEVRMAVRMPLLLRRHRPALAHFLHALPPFRPCPAIVTVQDISFENDPLAAALAAQRLGRRLVVAGPIVDEALADKLRVLGADLRGYVSQEELVRLYRGAQVLLFPSRYEGFGLPPLEAMACGTPVVCSNVSSLPEVVGDAAILVNPENVFDIARGITDMLLDEELRARMIRRGREQAARFSWSWTARQVLEIYQEVIGQLRRE